MSKIQIPKGTFDILPYGSEENWQLSYLWQWVEGLARKTASEYGYHEIRTPMYERTELFDRGVGETSDIVTKEMFTFEDKAGRSMSLRPEGTSAVIRSFIENNLAQIGSVHKFFYIAPMFRYERPQSGRYRQHHQFGVEAIGVAGPEQDAEVIDLLYQFYHRLGIQNLKVNLNTVGDAESRNHFRAALLDYLRPRFHELSADSQVRFEKNPLRILDSKDPKDREIVKSAPSILHYLTDSAKHHFQELCRLLDLIQIPYVLNDKIVRGLDYYNKTVFEFITEHLGAQNTIGAGGRYDGLLSTFQGPDLPSVGFGTGLERVIQVILGQKVELPKPSSTVIYFIPLGEPAREKCFALATLCRRHQIPADVEWNAKKMQAAMQNAVKSGAKYAAIIGEQELNAGAIQLKNLSTREQKEIRFDHLLGEMNHV
ncbi:MAG TPA: histidine--tRNA ligase [Chlamydiales bacterium]|nr:histidine--tRNA ligase [Chlamydiales bacterium]